MPKRIQVSSRLSFLSTSQYFKYELLTRYKSDGATVHYYSHHLYLLLILTSI